MDVLGNLELEKPAVLVVCAKDEDFVDGCIDGKVVGLEKVEDIPDVEKVEDIPDVGVCCDDVSVMEEDAKVEEKPVDH